MILLEVTPIMSLRKHELNKENNNRYAKADEREFRRPQSYRKNDRHIRNTQSGRNNLSKKRAQNLIFNNKYSTLKTNVNNFVHVNQYMFRKYVCVCVCVCVHVATTHEKKS